MAWTTPITFLANAILTASQVNVMQANLLALYNGEGAGWTSYTPTVGGMGSPTLSCRYNRTGGKNVDVEYSITMTGAGSAAFTMSLPTTAAGADRTSLGTVFLYDTSGSDSRIGAAYLFGGVVQFVVQTIASANGSWNNAQNGSPWTWASGDTIRGMLTYREA